MKTYFHGPTDFTKQFEIFRALNVTRHTSRHVTSRHKCDVLKKYVTARHNFKRFCDDMTPQFYTVTLRHVTLRLEKST